MSNTEWLEALGLHCAGSCGATRFILAASIRCPKFGRHGNTFDMNLLMSPEVRRIVLMVTLGVLGYLLVLTWDRDYGEVKESAPSTVQNTPATPTDAASAEIDSLPSVGAEPAAAEPPTDDVPGEDFAAPLSSTPSPQETQVAADRLVHVTTSVVDVWIDRLGGDIVELRLRRFPVTIDSDQSVTLFNQDGGNVYVAQSGLIGRDGRDKSGSRPLYAASEGPYEVDDGALEVVLRDQKDGVTIRKRFLFQADDYLIGVEHEIHNESESPFQAQMFAQLKRDAMRPESGVPMGPRPYVGAAFTTVDTRYEKIDFDELDDGPFRAQVEGGWAAVLQHYFVSAWVGDSAEVNAYFGRRLNDGNYAVGFVSPDVVVAPGERRTLAAGLYAGPKIQRRLEEIAPHLNLTVDYGFLWWMSVPLFHVLDAIHSVVGNWGVAIILLTFGVKLLLYPLASASYRSMAKMKKVMPQMKRLQERHAGDRQKLSQEMMALYKKEGANPLGGCLPLLVQMPVFLALYWVLLESVELRQAPFVLWIEDLATKDPWFVLPLLYGASFFAMQLMHPPPPDPMQARVMKAMPILFTVLFCFFPAGLVLYWLANNLLSLAQQWYITRKIEKASS